MLEKDAKTKWCPFGRLKLGDDGPAYNRHIDPRDDEETLSTLCVGSDCMAWERTSKEGTAQASAGYCALARATY